MKVRLACTAVVIIGTSLLLLAGIRCAQAAEIKIVSPSAYEDIEGEGSVGPGCCPPFRYQQVFPAADFAALGNQPHWIVSHTARPDESVTSPGTAHFPDIEIRLSTTQRGLADLSLSFDVNLGSDVMQYYRGPLNWVTVDAGPRPGPREFYHAEFPAGVTPFLYDPSQGNLLLDVIAWQGVSGSSRSDKVPGLLTAVAVQNALGTEGSLEGASVFQFTFVPVTPGDYNRDGTVDAADYVVWRKGLGTTYTQTDYDAWSANFGQTIGSGGALPSAEPLSIAVPEPVPWVMLLTGTLAIFRRRSDSAPCDLSSLVLNR